MNFPILLYLIPFLAAFATALVALPLCTKWCVRLGLVDDPGGRKLHEKPVPLAGGLTVMIALIMPTLLIIAALRLAQAYTDLKPVSTSPDSEAFSLATSISNTVPLATPDSNAFSLATSDSNTVAVATSISNTLAVATRGASPFSLASPDSNTLVLTPPVVNPFSLIHVSHAEYNILEFLMQGLNKRGIQLLAVYTGAFAIFLLGLLDDRHELGAAVKFIGQFLVTFLVATAGMHVSLFIPNQAFTYAVTILWILTVVNAFNFVDNMNGLSTGLGIVGAFYFFLIAAASGQYLIALIASLMCGALLGFLPHNFPRASAFLGDSGSHLVGYLLAILAILPHFYAVKHPPAILAVLSPLLILAVPLADLTWVVVYRTLHGKPFYVADTNHFSHRLVRLGLSRVKAVLLMWLAAILLGALSLIWN